MLLVRSHPAMFSRALPDTEWYQLGANIAIQAQANSQPLSPSSIEQMSAIPGLRDHLFAASSAN